MPTQQAAAPDPDWKLDETLVRLPQAESGLRAVLGEAPPPASNPRSRYTPRGLLGEGGMGQVAEVADSSLIRSVALKAMRPMLASDPEHRRRFLREARIQGQLDHPSIVPVYELSAGDADDPPWFTMRKVCGETLAEAPGKFGTRRLLTWFVQVCWTIEYAHSRQVLHLDLKPSNVMVGEFNEVYVLDWGLARIDASGHAAPNIEAALSGAAPATGVSGTPGYMSTEQLCGAALDRRADVYALGCMLFELLAGCPMASGKTLEELTALLPAERRSPRARSPQLQIPAVLDALVLEATEPDRDHRLGSARALAEAVERHLDGDRHSESLAVEARASIARAEALTCDLESATPNQREAAMGAVARALSLAPGHREANALFRKVLTCAPARLPAEVDRAVEQSEALSRGRLARAAFFRTAIWVALIPLVVAMHPRDPRQALGLGAVVLLGFVVNWRLSRVAEPTTWAVALLVATNAVGLAGLQLLFGPFVLVPCLAATSTLLISGHLRGRARAAAIVTMVVAVLGPFALEVLGFLAPSMAFVDDQIRILPRMVHFPPGASAVMLTLATLTSIATPAVLAGAMRDDLARAEARLQLMAWYLERLGTSAR